MIADVKLTELKIIRLQAGDVFHAMRKDDLGYLGFGEAYFSFVKKGHIKAWKRHREMTLNLVVPVGEIRIVIHDKRPGSKTFGEFQEILLSHDNYQRLTMPPNLWFGFQGVSEGINLLLNIANIPHDPDESERCDTNEIEYKWSSER